MMNIRFGLTEEVLEFAIGAVANETEAASAAKGGARVHTSITAWSEDLKVNLVLG
ncbi:MAG: hypothetical protein PHH36_09200 [Sideroxydans sp.]|nr:hypothetical protein [Sideroxydans sp.]